MKDNWNRIAVLGWGRVGKTVADMLDESGFEVSVFDKEKDGIDLRSVFDTTAALTDQDAVISCLPFHLNARIAAVAKHLGIHYFDLTEDVETTTQIRKLASGAEAVFMPQCGLAPGFIGVVGMSLVNSFPQGSVLDLSLRVGALPQNPQGRLGYACTWSPIGVINEYLKPCTKIINWEIRRVVGTMDSVPQFLNVGPTRLEAFDTSGGLGTLCETLVGQVPFVSYQTLRYPGHLAIMQTFLHDFRLFPEQAAAILLQTCPPTEKDVVFVSADVALDEAARRNPVNVTASPDTSFERVYKPIIIAGEWRTAISWTTAAGVCAAVELVKRGWLPQTGFIRQEQMRLPDFFSTRWGGLLQ